VSALRIVQRIAEVREAVAGWRAGGARIAFVPTMGNLHPGHFSLVEQACSAGTRVVASVFVNPTQFGPSEDFARYPRTLDDDAAGLAARGCDLLFAPTVDEMYPHGLRDLVQVRVPGLEDILCGAFRPGHFSGVATVVARLLGIVQPDRAVFGAKDWQQLQVVRRMVEDLAMPVEIEAGPTVREADGLAMSSRNQYLEPAERARAACLFATLRSVREQVLAGATPESAERHALDELRVAGFRPDYVAVRLADDLRAPVVANGPRIVLAAAWLGRTRLIDNLLIDRG
jgi:pantoate--beta-alanine ligase